MQWMLCVEFKLLPALFGQIASVDATLLEDRHSNVPRVNDCRHVDDVENHLYGTIHLHRHFSDRFTSEHTTIRCRY